jgi:hypothetical protein
VIAATGGALLICSLFLHWYGVTYNAANAGSISVDESGWEALHLARFVFVAVGLLAIVPAAIDIFELDVELPFDSGLVVLLSGALAILWVITRMLVRPEGLELRLGIFVGLIAGAVIVYGAFRQAEPALQRK